MLSVFPVSVVLAAQEGRTEVISLDAPAVDCIEFKLLGLDGTPFLAGETSNLAAVTARSMLNRLSKKYARLRPKWLGLTGLQLEGYTNKEDVRSILLESMTVWNWNQGRLRNRLLLA